MALLWMDSFDHYVTADLAEKYAFVNAAFTILAAGNGRHGSGCASSDSTTLSSLTPPVTAAAGAPAGSTTLVVGYALRISAAANLTMVQVLSAGTVQASVHFNASNFAQAFRGTNSGSLLGTASVGALPTAAFAYVEAKIVLHPSAGSIVVRVNEVVVLDVTGVNTTATGTALWDTVRIGGQNAGSSSWRVEDLYILDGTGPAPLNTFLGDCRVDARLPTAEGASSAWTPSAGTDNALMVDEAAPNDDVDFNATPTVGATDTHVVQDAPVPGAVFYGVQLSLSQKKTDAGTCAIAPVVRHAGVDQVGAAGNPGTAYAFRVVPYGTNPGTGAAWTEAEFNAAEFGYRRTA